jgi:hypothetical protein
MNEVKSKVLQILHERNHALVQEMFDLDRDFDWDKGYNHNKPIMDKVDLIWAKHTELVNMIEKIELEV